MTQQIRTWSEKMHPDEHEILIPAPRARIEHLGGVSAMTEYRWSKDPKLAFPKPIVINRRKFYRLAELKAFKNRHALQLQ
jgi:hypothetical protein